MKTNNDDDNEVGDKENKNGENEENGENEDSGNVQRFTWMYLDDGENKDDAGENDVGIK